MYSGSEYFLDALTQFSEHCSVAFDVPPLEFTHVMSIEIEHWKRQWIMESQSVEHVFGDAASVIHSIKQENGKAFCYNCGHYCSIPQCGWIGIGFAYCNLSPLRIDRSAQDRVLVEATGKSGTTASSAVQCDAELFCAHASARGR